MEYLIRQIELTAPIPPITLDQRQNGIALVLRRNDRPAGFIMGPCPPGTRLEPGEISDWIRREAGGEILANRLRDELIVSEPPRPTPSLTLAICTRDHPDLVKRCLESILPHRPGTNDKVLIVDNAPSSQATEEMVAGMPGVRYVREPKTGLDFARNSALANATGEYVAFIDDDAVIDRSWFEGFRRACEENPGAGAYTGPVLPYELATQAQVLFEARGGFRRGFRPMRHDANSRRSKYHPCDAGVFGAGCNMVVRREAVLQLGGFDEALDTGRPLPGGGDLDIFYRILRAGYTLAYEPWLVVYHQHRREHRELRRQMWTWGLGMMAFVTKTFAADPPMRRKLGVMAVNWFAYMARLTAKSAIGRNSHPWTADLGVAEMLGGMAGLCGEYKRSMARIARIRSQFS